LWPLIIRIVWDKTDARTALTAGAISGGTISVLMMVFFLWGPDVFAPLETSDFIALFNLYVPGAGKVVLGGLVACIVWSATAAKPNGTDGTYFRRAALITAIPILPIFVLPWFIGYLFQPQWWPTYLLLPALLCGWAAGLPNRGAPQSGRKQLPLGARGALLLVAAIAIAAILLSPLGEMKQPAALMQEIASNHIDPKTLRETDLQEAIGMRSGSVNGGRYGRETPLVEASRKGQLTAVTQLLAAGANPRVGRNAYAICAARYYGWKNVEQLLNQAGTPSEVWCGKKKLSETRPSTVVMSGG
jgi:hypothetical protein